jgi:hypothetical protein
MRVKVQETEKIFERLPPFIINRHNRHLFERQNDVYLRKSRLSTVIHVDIYGRIIKIEGINPNSNKIGESIYK